MYIWIWIQRAKKKSSYWLPGCYTCPPVGEVPWDLLPPPANRCTERRAAIGYLDVILVRQWEKSHEICSLLQPTIVQKEEQILATWMLYLSASGRSPMRSAPSSSQPLYRKKSNYWLPGYHTCPPMGVVPWDLLLPPANRCRGRRAGFDQSSDSHPSQQKCINKNLTGFVILEMLLWWVLYILRSIFPSHG